MPTQKIPIRRDAKLVVLSIALIVLLVLVAIGLRYATARAQAAPNQPIPKIGRAWQAETIDSVASQLEAVYVYPDVAKKMEKLVRQNLKQGKYDSLTDPSAFTQALTADLLSVRYSPQLAADFATADTITDSMRQVEAERTRFDNYGFYRVERLPGNIGYLDLRYFDDASEAGPTAIAAMNFLGNCDALIFDMRWNGGGEPSMIQLISSYLFDEPKHLNSFYIRAKDTIQQFWTSAYVQGRRMSNADVYVLTSSSTFSGAEEFSYNLKNMKRATIIGETTGGGAHPVGAHAFLNLGVEIGVPYGRAINPITHTNWEGVGVKPDIEVPASQALTVARVEALKRLHDKATSEDRRRVLTWELETQESEQHPAQVDPAAVQKYTGTYGPRKVTLDNGEMFYQREGRPRYHMIPMTPATFRLDAPEMGNFRLKFLANEQGTVTEVVGLYSDGREDHSPRTGN